jgi:hypothetical protein
MKRPYLHVFALALLLSGAAWPVSAQKGAEHFGRGVALERAQQREQAVSSGPVSFRKESSFSLK